MTLSWEPEVRALNPNDRNILMAFHGITEGKLAESSPPPMRTKLAFEGYGFRYPEDALTWVVDSPEAAEYDAQILYEKPVSIESEVYIEVEANGRKSRIIPKEAKIPDGPGRLRNRRHHLDSVFPLKEGLNLIKVRMVPKGTSPSLTDKIQFKLFSLELTRKKAIAEIEKRATALKSDISWMIEGKYGLFTHWSPLCYPLYGDVRADETYQQGVETFDVGAYVDKVVETGAAWVVFTTAHGPQFWPGPNKTLDGILPGRTAKRDLIGELADALAQKGIRLMLYYHHGRGDEAYMKASGMLDADPSRWFDNVVAMHREISERYGKRLYGSGAYIDGSFNVYYQYAFPFERLSRAMKSGNPEAIVGYSSDRGPAITPFSDIFVSDGNKWLAGPLPKEWYEPGGPYHGQNPAWFLFMDEWIPRKPLNGTFTADPAHSTEEFVDYFKRMDAADIPVTINLLITQDVTRDQPFMNEKSLAIMREVRKAIRGK
ncbi:MAG: alpha-L-fucosidase [Verrucomicrobiae bacterium]|nr:alpha-L-fucosidase [Verrucomicrobiae bacterium]